MDGDDTVTMPLPPSDRNLVLTKEYVKAIANTTNENESCNNPILSVLVIKTFHKTDESNFASTPQSLKFTDLKLVDGDGQKIHARLNRNLVDVGRSLERGDMIRLDVFTPLHYRINESSPRMPMLFVHQLSRVGKCHLEDSEVKMEMLACNHQVQTLQEPVTEDDYYVVDPRIHNKPCCTSDHRLCALNGLRFIACVCDAFPVDNLNLETIKADCYFATDDLADISNTHKRNMVYWWYATNVYCIVGKGKVEHLPLCLEYAIRKKWPNPDDLPYKGNRKRKN